MESDILLVDKPVGITSFDVIRRLRRELGIKKIGHAGTLDPLASGLMIVGVGEGTKKLTEYIKLPKEYVAEVRIGERRTTGDLEGDIVEKKTVENLDREMVASALLSMVGTLSLRVPAYAAVKQGGEALYKKARKGEMVEVPVRDMVVTETELLDFSCADVQCVAAVRFAVASGVYIRSLGEELGQRLGYPATLQALRRTRIGDFSIEDARAI